MGKRTPLENLTSCGWSLHHPELHMQENKNGGLNYKIQENRIQWKNLNLHVFKMSMLKTNWGF